jgi:hypothetical protein
MAEFEHAAETAVDQWAKDGVQTEGEGVFDVIGEEAAIAVGQELVTVPPVGEGAGLLQIGEEAVGFVFGVEGDPGEEERAEEEAKLEAGADGNAAGLGDDSDLLPRGEEELEGVGALVEGEDLGGGVGEAGLMEVGAVGVHYPFCDAA